jgi:lipoprotein NlpI
LAPREVSVLNERGNAYFGKRDWDHALADYTAAIANDPRSAVLFHNRGEVWRMTNDYRRARQDFDSAIKLKPDYDSAYVRRGLVRVAERNYKDALPDFDKAVQINPNSPGNLAARGVARFFVGRYAEAETDLAASSALDPRNPYGVLWLYVARKHQNKDGSAALRDQTRQLNLNLFPGPVIRYFLGQASVDDVMRATQKGSDYERRTQLCEASFYLGEEALLRGDRNEAARLFRQAAGVGVTHLYEHQGAMVELQRLGL